MPSPSPPDLRVDVVPVRDRVVVVPEGEVDLATIGLLESAVTDLRERGSTHLVIDLRGVSFIDSTGLRFLVVQHQEARADGWRFEITDGPTAVARALEVSGLSDTFERAVSIFDDSNARPASGLTKPLERSDQVVDAGLRPLEGSR